MQTVSETAAEPVTGLGQSGRDTKAVYWLLVRVFTALVLLAAAALKAHELATSPVAGEGLLESRPAMVILVEYELLLGLWLLSGWRPRLSRVVALVTFTVFAVMALTKVIGGDASCGCFGKVTLNPWVTLGLDIAILVLLFFARPLRVAGASAASKPSHANAWVAAVIALLVGTPAAWWMSSYEPSALAESGVLIGDDPFVVLEPETWVDKPLPILPFIDIGDTLRDGNWLLVFYRHDCSHCVQTLPAVEQEAKRRASADQSSGVVLVELPPYAPGDADPVPPTTVCVRARLSDEREWFVETPAILALSDGWVTGFSKQLTH